MSRFPLLLIVWLTMPFLLQGQTPLTTNVYSELVLGTFEQPGSPNGDFCYSAVHPYGQYSIGLAVPGMQHILRIDDITGPAGSVSATFTEQSGYVVLESGMEFQLSNPSYALTPRYYFTEEATVHYSLLLRGTPLVPGLPYYPTFEKVDGTWQSNICNAPSSYHFAVGDSIFVQQGTTPSIGPTCAEAAELLPGLNWYAPFSAQLLTGDLPPCWYTGASSGYYGSWYSFTTPEEEVSLNLQSNFYSVSQDINLSGVQMALYDACNGSILSCAGTDEEFSFETLHMPCGILAPNTTYYVLVGGLPEQPASFIYGLATLNFNMSLCTIPGCTDPLSCTYNPQANTDDGSCYYDSDCPEPMALPILINYTCNYFVFQCPFPITGGFYTMNGMVGNPMFSQNGTLYYISEEVGEHTICFTNQSPSGQIYQACTTVEIPETCFELCILGYSVEEGAEPCTYNFSAQVNSAYDPAMVQWSFPGLGQTFTGSIVTTVFPTNGEYTYSVLGADSSACQISMYYGTVLVTNCTGALVYGCTEPLALNFNPAANVNDGSCIYEECALSLIALPDTLNPTMLTIIPSVSPMQAVYIEWHFGDGNSSTELFPTHSYTDDGPFELCVFMVYMLSDDTPCEVDACITIDGSMVEGSGFTGGFTIVVQDPVVLSLPEIKPLTMLLWPNPVSGMLYYNHSEVFTHLRLMDIQGRVVQWINTSGRQGSIDVSALPSGTFLLEGLSPNGRVVQRIVVQ